MNAGRVYALVLRLTANKINARDLTKEVFLTTRDQISFFRDDISFASWIIGITVYTVLEAMRKNGILEDEKDTKKKFFGKNKKEDLITRLAAEGSFEDNILSLPERERVVFILHDVEEYTDEETADILFLNKPEMNEILEQAHKHLETAGNFIESIKTLKEKVAFLSKKIEPPADLWKEIFGELHRKKSQIIKEQKVNEIVAEEQPDEVNFVKSKKKKGHWAGELKRQTGESSIPGERKGLIDRVKRISPKTRNISIIFIILLAAGYFIFSAESKMWSISALKGTPLLSGKRLNVISSLAGGDELKTDRLSKALVKIPNVGQIEVEPETILHRENGGAKLKLDIGKILVDENKAAEFLTADVSGVSIKDFYKGGYYTLSVDDAGTAILYVRKSWEIVNDNKFETFVTPGCYCEIIFGRGAGIPYSQKSSEEFKSDISHFSPSSYTPDMLDKILSEAKTADAVSLWNLIRRVNGQDGEKVVSTLEKFVPLPAGATEDAMIKLNDKALLKWLTVIVD